MSHLVKGVNGLRVPQTSKESVSKEEAAAVKEKREGAGGKVEMK